MTDKTKPKVTVGTVVHVDPSKTTLTAALATIPVDKNGNVIMPIGRSPRWSANDVNAWVKNV